MNIIKTPVISLPDMPIFGLIISSDELTNYFAANDIIKIAEQKAQAIYQASLSHREKIVQECDDLRQAAYQDGLRLLEQEAPNIRQKTVADTIEWLVAEHQLEQNILVRLESCLHKTLINIVESFFIENSSAKLLAKQLKDKLEMMNNEKAATLYIHSSQYDEFAELFSDYPWLNIILDDTKGKDEALLSSSLFNLHINLQEQFKSICERILLTK